MEKVILIFLALLFASKADALNIREVRISTISPNSINVSVDTEAVELYYFHSMQYIISQNAITIEACYISGFGSTIEFLNNNFEIPIDSETAGNYTMTVKVCYLNLPGANGQLQDEWTILFSTPMQGEIVLNNSVMKTNDIVLFPNPAHDYLMFSKTVKNIIICDMTGRLIKRFRDSAECIDLSDIQPGVYYINFIHEKCMRIFVKE